MQTNNQELFYEKQQTVRLTKPEAEFINENYEAIAETSERIPFKDFFMNAVTGATSKLSAKPLIKEISKQTDLDTIETLKAKINELTTVNDTLKIDNEGLLGEVRSLTAYKENIKLKLSTDSIILNFDPKWRKYLWGVLQTYIKLNPEVDSYEKIIQLVFRAVNNRGELTLTEKDYQYLDSLDYPFTEPTETTEPKTETETLKKV